MSKDIKVEISVSEDIGNSIKILVRHICNGELKILSQSFVNDGSKDAKEKAQFVIDYATVQSSLLIQESLDKCVEELMGEK